MKRLFLATFTFLFLHTAFAAPKKYKLLKNTSSWTVASNWSPAGYPVSGDTVLIPGGIILTLTTNLDLNNLYVDVFGSILLSGNSKVKLSGKSVINVHTGALFYGSSASQQVSLGSFTYKGKDPVVIGPQMWTSVSAGFKPYVEFAVLPVKFVSFTVAHSHSGFLVQWATTEEVNASYYEVQRSVDGSLWTNSATVNAAGRATTNYYTHIDRSVAAGTIYYRVKQVDADGAFMYTEIRMVKTGEAAAPVIASAQNKIIVQFARQVTGQVRVEVIGLNGTIAFARTFSEPTGNLQLATGLKGIYIVRLSNGRDLHMAKQISL